MTTKLKNIRRTYEAIKTGFDSMMEPEQLKQQEHAPTTICDHVQAIDAMFEAADRYGKECWIPR